MSAGALQPGNLTATRIADSVSIDRKRKQDMADRGLKGRNLIFQDMADRNRVFAPSEVPLPSQIQSSSG